MPPFGRVAQLIGNAAVLSRSRSASQGALEKLDTTRHSNTLRLGFATAALEFGQQARFLAPLRITAFPERRHFVGFGVDPFGGTIPSRARSHPHSAFVLSISSSLPDYVLDNVEFTKESRLVICKILQTIVRILHVELNRFAEG
jgi:hypothetical protein